MWCRRGVVVVNGRIEDEFWGHAGHPFRRFRVTIGWDESHSQRTRDATRMPDPEALARIEIDRHLGWPIGACGTATQWHRRGRASRMDSLEDMMVDEHRDAFTTQRPAPLSRRTTLKAGGIGLAAMAGLMARSGDAQQEDLPEIIVAFLAGWTALDADQIAQTYAADGDRADVTTPTVFHGKDEIRRSLTEFFGAFSNATVEHPAVLVGNDGYAADTWIFAGTYTGTMPGFPPGTGQPVTIRGFTLIELGNEVIQQTTDYYDAYGILVQLGVVAPLGQMGAPEATPTG